MQEKKYGMTVYMHQHVGWRIKKIIPGTLLWDENPRGRYSRLTSKEQPQQWLGVGSIVYLKDCFNFCRVAQFFNKSLGEMKLSPLLIAQMGKFSNFDEYTLRLLDSEEEYTINNSDYPKFEFCWLKDSQQKLGEYSAFVKAKEEEAARKELIRESERQQRADAFKEKCQKLASKIKLGTKFFRGTDTYTVEEISGDKYVMRYFRGKIEATAKDLIIGWYQLIE